MKLSDVNKIWEVLSTFHHTGDVEFCDLERAIEVIVGIENDIPNCQSDKNDCELPEPEWSFDNNGLVCTIPNLPRLTDKKND